MQNEIATKPVLTGQEVFETVVRHAATMGGQSLMDSGLCAYRGDGGVACFVGALLTDEEAKRFDKLTIDRLADKDESMGGGVSDLHASGDLPARLVPFLGMLKELQRIHDENRPDQWPLSLKVAGVQHKLDISVVDEVFASKLETVQP